MLLKNKNEDSSFLQILEESSQIASGPNSITTTRDGGNFINGPLSISSPHTSIRFGGVFKFNPLTATCIPSTIATPIPTFTLDIPVQGIGSLSLIAGILASIL